MDKVSDERRMSTVVTRCSRLGHDGCGRAEQELEKIVPVQSNYTGAISRVD